MVGHYVSNIDHVDGKFRCSICSLLLRVPMQLPCGHRQCKSCAESIDRQLVKCKECTEESVKDNILLDRGCSNDMQTLKVACDLCSWMGLFKEYENHLTTVHTNVVCNYCDQHFDFITDLDLHKLTVCSNVVISCPLKDFGCLHQCKRCEMAAHYMTEHHQNTLNAIVCQSIPNRISNQNTTSCNMNVDTAHHITTTMVSLNDDNSNSSLEETYKMVDVFSVGIHALDNDNQRFNDELLQMRIQKEELSKNLTILKSSIEEENVFLDAIKPNQEILSQDVASLEQYVDDSEFVSYNGTLIWIIRSVREKLGDARSERQTSIYSPPFYSSPMGYKMRARLYLNGDGNARRTHISLFFVLMRSKHDSLLKFPFNYKVTFCMYDQTPNQRHIIDSFRPDIKSNSFQRPRSEMNIASGIPKFAPLSVIEQEGNPYVQNDAMFIKVMVDFAEMPKTLLPYALSLNPGLPVYIQQQMIREEKERRDQQALTLRSSSAIK